MFDLFAQKKSAPSVSVPRERKEKVAFLKDLSDRVRPDVGTKYKTVNEGIKAIYAEMERTDDFRTIHQWRAAGMPVKKGSVAFPI